MLIVNKWNVTTPNAVAAVNGGGANGITSTEWAGANPSTAGVTGNAQAGVGFTNITTNVTYSDQLISKIISITMSGGLTAGQDNYLRIPLSQFGLNGSKQVLGVATLGVINPNPAADTPTYINTTGILTSVTNNTLFLKIVNNNQALYQNKILNLLVFYSTSP